MQTTQYLTIKGVWKMGLKKGCILMTAALAVLLFVGQADANTAASADFDGNGEVGVPDFLLFIATFGSRQGDEKYEARYDLDGNGEIGVPDFLIFLDFFGQKVPSQREVLVALYNATGGPNWTNNTNWLTDNDISTWHGVKASDGWITYLSLRTNNLTGEIPVELGNLTELTHLDLNYNQLSGGIPVELGNLANLTLLKFSGNALSGEIPVALGNLTKLRILAFDGNALSGGIPVELGNLTNLGDLNLGGNRLSGTLPQSLTGLTKLTKFHFWGEGGLCAPSDAAFQTWLQGIENANGPNCSQ